MEFVIWVETRIAGRAADIQQVATVDRPVGIKAAEEIGLSLADGKVIIGQIQRRIVEMQFQVRLARDQGASLQSWYNAAIDSQVRPGDVTGKRTAQEDDSVRDFINTTDSAKRNLGNLQKSRLVSSTASSTRPSAFPAPPASISLYPLQLP